MTLNQPQNQMLDQNLIYFFSQHAARQGVQLKRRERTSRPAALCRLAAATVLGTAKKVGPKGSTLCSREHNHQYSKRQSVLNPCNSSTDALKLPLQGREPTPSRSTWSLGTIRLSPSAIQLGEWLAALAHSHICSPGAVQACLEPLCKKRKELIWLHCAMGPTPLRVKV